MLTQKELNIINEARELMKKHLKYDNTVWSGKFTNNKKKEIINFLQLLDLEIWDTKLKENINGCIIYLKSLWNID